MAIKAYENYQILLTIESLDNAIYSTALIGLAIMVYEPLTMLSKYGNCMCLLKN